MARQLDHAARLRARGDGGAHRSALHHHVIEPRRRCRPPRLRLLRGEAPALLGSSLGRARLLGIRARLGGGGVFSGRRCGRTRSWLRWRSRRGGRASGLARRQACRRLAADGGESGSTAAAKVRPLLGGGCGGRSGRIGRADLLLGRREDTLELALRGCCRGQARPVHIAGTVRAICDVELLQLGHHLGVRLIQPHAQQSVLATRARTLLPDECGLLPPALALGCAHLRCRRAVGRRDRAARPVGLVVEAAARGNGRVPLDARLRKLWPKRRCAGNLRTHRQQPVARRRGRV